jgi:predicted RNase H-like HicB family nuclease
MRTWLALQTSARHLEDELREAIRFHVAAMKGDGLPVPERTSVADDIEA